MFVDTYMDKMDRCSETERHLTVNTVTRVWLQDSPTHAIIGYLNIQVSCSQIQCQHTNGFLYHTTQHASYPTVTHV